MSAAAERLCEAGCGAVVDLPHARFCARCRSIKRRKPTTYVATPQADQVVREAYHRFRQHGNRKAIKLAALKLGWPKWRVNRRGRELGLARAKEEPWSDREEQLLERYAWMCPEKIAERFRRCGFSRTPTAIHLKRKRMRIRANGEWYTATQLAEAFGEDSHKVLRWIRCGALKAERRGTARTEAQGGDSWLITRADLHNFVMAYPDEYDLAKVEKFWFLDLLTEGRICR
jgi:hypothetical protein